MEFNLIQYDGNLRHPNCSDETMSPMAPRLIYDHNNP